MNKEPTYKELEQRIKVLEKEAARCNIAEEALCKERDFTSAVLATAGVLVVVIDPQGRIVRFNKACERLTGYTFAEVKDKHVWDLFLIPEEVEPVKAVFAELRTGQFPNEFENYWVAKGGRRILIMWSNTALSSQEGSVEYVIGTGIDITERKKAERALRDSEDRYRRITEAITDYIYTVRIQEGSPVETVHGAACEAVAGYTAEDFIANPHLWIQMIPDDDREPVESQAALVLSGVKPEPLEHRIIRKDGSIRWVRNTPVPNFDSDGRLLSYDGLIQDITERKQAEEALRESEANYRLLFSAESDAILVMDAQTKTLVDANDAALALYGYDRDEFLGLMAIQISAEPEESAAHIERVASGTPSVVSPGPVERLHRKKDGTIFPVEISSGVYMLQACRMVCAIIRDITERRQAEEALRKAHTELEKFNLELEKKVQERTEELKQKNKQLVDAERLVAIGKMANRVAHELRNPLTAIGGLARRINERTPADNPNKKYLRMIVDEVITMENKVSEITRIQ
jgi:PAS domain S-box-containing protein